ncbi:hypothetical protein Bca52824_081024 [Brassica carinata]|uniref:Uncharacterized protein n=1 Tax=Brassica carinata TaxID=52824 RepID=A0A8X7PH48_BRACI|nr:hypothetical protein Bca52824_081024 [Brassica carinata]
MVSEQSILGKPVSMARRRKIPLKYSCEEIYDRMSSGLCIFHRGVEVIMIESEDQPIVTKDDDEPIVEESLVESDDFVTGTVMKPNSLECLISERKILQPNSLLQILDPTSQKEAQNKSDAEENMSFSLGNKIEHMVGKHAQKADRIWEPGGFMFKPDRQMLQAEVVLHGQVLCSGPEELKNDRLQSCIGMNLCEFRIDHGVDILFAHQMHHIKEMCVLRVWEQCGFEIYGLKRTKQMVNFINQGPKVEEMLMVKVDPVYLHVKELEVFPEKTTGSNDANVSKRLCEQVPLRVMSTEKHGQYLRAWKFKFKSKNLIGACANKKRPLDPGITKIFEPLVCLGAQNKECEAELEIYMHHSSKTQKLCVMYHCSEMEFSGFKKLHEMGLQRNPELVSSLVKDTQDRIVNAWFKTPRVLNMGFAITRRWFSVVHLLCAMSISLWTAVRWDRKTRKKEDENRLSWDALLVRYKELKHFMQKICEDLIQAGYEEIISNYSCHKANTVKELAATDVRVRLHWETITEVTVALFSGCSITKNFTEYIKQQGMQDHAGFNQFLFGTEMFQVKHKWRYKPFPIVSELELKDQAALDTRNEDVLSGYTTDQAREEMVSSHVEVRRTIEMSQSKAWIFKFNDKRRERDRNETQQQALKIKLGQSRYYREVQKLEFTSMAGNHVHIDRCFSGFCVNEVFHLQRPPEMLAEKDQQRCYDGFSTEFLSSLRTRMFSTREYCDRINWLSFWFSYLISLV